MNKIFSLLMAALLLLAAACNRGYSIMGEIPAEGSEGRRFI